MYTLKKDLLSVKIYETREEMGVDAASDIKTAILCALDKKESINMIFAAAPSQNDVLRALVEDREIPWSRVNAFHMDEYLGLSKDDTQCFGNFLYRQIFKHVNFRSVNYIDSSAQDAERECERYAELLLGKMVDIVVLGIGENGHIAFNDPHVADFCDPKAVKIVSLDDVCRKQQVNDRCFDILCDVPTTAITLTIPTLFSGEQLFCVVPAITKAKAVLNTLTCEIGEACPATILRRHKNATLYLDKDSSSLLQCKI